MHIIVVGLNYRTAPVEVRERFTFSEKDMPKALKQLQQTKSIMECVIVATCNRTELYAVVDRPHLCGHYIRNFMEQWFNLPRQQFTTDLYMYEDEKAIDHLFRVTCGLDSMVIGETQILGQVKQAFSLAQEHKTTGTLFNAIFKQAVTLAKKAHSETSIGESAVSVSYAAVELGKRIFGQFNGKTVMIIGAGKMSELTAKHLYANGVKRVFVVNRTYDRAVQLADKFNGIPLSMIDAIQKLPETDIVISSTGSDGYVLTREQMATAMHKRKSRPLFMIDIAVPRDLDPAIASVENVFLYDIDDLEGIVESNLDQRRTEAAKIEVFITEEILAYRQWYKTLGVAPLIRALQDKAASIHQETMDSLTNKLPDLGEREMKIIRKLTKSIVNQMLSDPIVRVKELAGEKHADEAMDMFVKIFALEETLEQAKEDKRKTAVLTEAPLAADSSSTFGIGLNAQTAAGSIAAVTR
ncbi:glutamyl-tRNA reductase [Paenibacillus baekrokdamisoli]|uniref:Glutamyl-tRNA reductase n=1 Tax=Paenibacillus baekrokdamisoli TaxID=1712516 RepID=A0A3G9IJL6_9BACL|nr:glutamyl-tRNA reductase [Paenibacillus baekrokdamisoli]MBB3067616.1 glutamyl-tRNA reductase [Paenibacillus baekrokdamisoli]BBH19197.1 glutamyl-tRNA reductase [Paenibacillus baekrokdamisoli]